MFHQIRWTAQKISQRLALVDSLVYRRRIPLPNFCFLKLIGPEETPPIAADVDDSNWLVVEPGTIWAKPDTNFILRTQFQLPADWDKSLPIALYLPIGEAGDFSHPEALVYVDGSRVIDFFRNLEETVDDRLPTWNGELYLEYHRGTYTTQARNKRANRKCEFLLHDAEFLASWASVYWVNTISATVFCHTLARSATKP